MSETDRFRRPRVRVTLNGTVVSGCVSAEINSRRGSCASTFRLEFVETALSSAIGQDWPDQDTLPISIDLAFAENDLASPTAWTSMLSGVTDRIALEPLSGFVVLEGRDNAALLIDLPLEDGYLNRTASEVVQDLGERCGLSVDADETSGLIGQYYQIQHNKTVFSAYSKHSNGWDLLCELAQLQNYELWVDGSTLHFRQPTDDTKPFVVRLDRRDSRRAMSCSSMLTLSLDRAIGVSGPIQVRVSSWNSRQKQTIVETYPPDAAAGAKLYAVLKPNLLADQAQALAASTYAQIRARQRVLSASMPGELTLAPRRALQLAGTGTGWDTTYIVDGVTRRITADRGFTQHLTAVTTQDGA